MSRDSAKSKAAPAGDVTSPGHGSPADIAEWLTRTEVAELLRVSVTTVRRLQGRDLHPERSEEGVYLFDPCEVEELRTRRPPPPEPRDCRDPGELAAEAFKLLRDGADVRDLVIALRRPAAEVAAIYAEWESMGGALVISDVVQAQLARMVRQGLLSAEVFQAIEDDDGDLMCDLVTDAVQARRAR